MKPILYKSIQIFNLPFDELTEEQKEKVEEETKRREEGEIW